MKPDLLGLLAFGFAGASALAVFLRPERRPVWTSRTFFLLLLAGALFTGQQRAIRANFQLWNPDESHMIGGALTLRARPVFWRDVDGNSHGPLNQFPLLAPALLGFRVDYTSARIVGAVINILTLLAVQMALAAWCSEGAGRLLVLPAWALFIFNQDPEIAQYTTEQFSAMLVAVAAAVAARVLAAGRWRPGQLWAAGLLCGAAPLGKLQSLPIAAWIFVCLAGYLAWQSRRTGASPWRPLAGLVVAALVPAVLIVGFTAWHGAFFDFRIRFLDAYLIGYTTGEVDFFTIAPPYPGLLFGLPQFLWPLIGGLLLAGAGLAWQRRPPPAALLILTAGTLLAAVAAIYLPRKPFGHYFMLLPGPLLLLLGTVAGPLLDGWRTSAFRAVAGLTALVGLSGLFVAHHFRHPEAFHRLVLQRPAIPQTLIEAVQRHVAPGELFAIWGWQPALQVFSQTVSSTRDIVTFWQIAPSAWRDYYRASYLRDITARPPVVFVDTTGPGDFAFHHAPSYRHENFPELADFIRRNYVLTETVAGCRIYIRRERAAPPPSAL
ncbi:MAG: hypothetical protein ACOZE5_02700 [Verrucomicrobiota bacterium]